MTDLMEIEAEEYQDVGSLNHSIVQTRMAGFLLNDERFTAMVELSLDARQIDLSQFGLKAKEELKPDICLYPNSVGLKRRDVLRMPEMPLLAIEVVSPKQGIDDILAKFDAYFALEVKSCWLVTPTLQIVTVYSEPDNFKTFDKMATEVIDDILDIRVPLQKIFS
ncbi:MAG: hypothetical protein DRR16_30460 [Candidatus Parabeggiatoa sp. nov. 3]|nr:MAG: hypothetical protein DRR00_27315 [Gammaproteobacteria bacterium]RKZ58894.1 MAG: hypothetical protein DRQ99_24700 [Gammaproteobacteria bacterium]RKZ76356.1 MAG: hypothetical protein DRR16_30460 [Gammaproteobacteria bacterium]